MTRILMDAPLLWSAGSEYGLVAVRRLASAGVPLKVTLAGEGPERERLLFAVADMQLGDVVELLAPGASAGDAGCHDVFLLPALRDGCWPTLVRALDGGLPVVTSKLPRLEALVGEGIAGLCVTVRDTDAIAAALRRLCEDRELRASMSAAARRRSAEEAAGR